MNGQILVVRNNNGKSFSIGDTVTIEESFKGVINAFEQFNKEIRVHLKVDEDSNDPEYWSLSELD